MWFLPALVTLVAWGAADLFYKKGNNAKDRYSALKTVVMVGLVMGLHALFYYVVYEGIHYDFSNLILYLPVSSMYILSMALGYFGLRYIEVSVSSPIGNSSGAVVVLLSFFIMKETMAPLQWAAVIVIILGLFLLSVFEKQEFDHELAARGEKVDPKYRVGAIAIIFPLLYCVIDGLGTFFDGIYLDYRQILPEDQANMSYELTFFIVALLVWGYLALVKKEKVNPFREKDKGLAAIFETLGQFFYVFAMSGNAIVAAPMIASYSVVSIIFARIFLKEKLSNKQYVAVLFVMIAIAVLGFYDG
ncbi:DMT family transporter [Enterococcus nangangensis]|uniref:DMT family transporter n=1 Tax=Enterococcus nangangensis TaxID=2559926 RepID=UPI0010F5B4A2|nr:DMT family transporter [Enterococcus nangangensis]